MCRVPRSALRHVTTLDSPLQACDWVDLSSQKACHSCLAPYTTEWMVSGCLEFLPMAYAVTEVLVAWHGLVPRHLFEVLDETTGDFARMLEDQVRPLVSSHASWQTVRKHSFWMSVCFELCGSAPKG